MNEWIKTYEQMPPLNEDVELKVIVNGEERIYINKLIPMMNGTYIWAYCNYDYDEVIEWRRLLQKGTRIMIYHSGEYGTILGYCELRGRLAYGVEGTQDYCILYPEDFKALESDVN